MPDIRQRKRKMSNFLDIPKMGYVIIYKNSGDMFGNLIEKKQIQSGFNFRDACYTHSEISGGGKHSINISPPISKLIDITKVHKGRYIRIVRYKNKEYEEGKRYKVAYFSATLCNRGYDFGGIAAFIFKWIKHNNRLWFCSEGCAYALRMVFPNALGKLENSQIMPAHFLLPEYFEIVYEGIIPDIV